MTINKLPGRSARRGTALVTILVLTSVVTILAAAALTVTRSSVIEVESERRRAQALYAAEAGVNATLADIAVGYRTGQDVTASIGTMDQPAGSHQTQFYTSLVDNGDDSLTIQSTGTVGNMRRTIEVIVEPVSDGPMDHAMYAGNFSDDASYQLEYGGEDGQADEVTGDIYSGGDIVLTGDAEIHGDVSSGGTITGTSGRENVELDVPQILGTDYSVFNDYDVASLFDGAPRTWDNSGGTAGQLPSDNPAHIFRKNPSDRDSHNNATEKDDYFFEDPYESVRSDSSQDGSNAFEVSLPADANNKVFYIDGNVWVHNYRTYSMKISNEGNDPTRVTFVVRGNVYFSDNLFYDDPSNDGVAFIALTDDNVEDSGNIYFGDPKFGTMKFAESLFFAENNFIDSNLDAAGSSTVEIRGNMTAGNQIAIERDYEHSDGSTSHTRLKLEFDDRQSTGFLNLPGIPTQQDDPVGYTVSSWREVPNPDVFVVADPTVEVPSPVEKSPPAADPFAGDPDKDWRMRWATEFGEEWKEPKRKGKWGHKKKKKKRNKRGMGR